MVISASRPGLLATKDMHGSDRRRPSVGKLSRCAVLRRELLSQELTFLMEAHNGLSAKLVEEAGFPAIWASGLAISASLGLRDSNEASWTQVMEILEYMSDATRLPILVDGDTGHGNFNNVRRFVRKLCERGIAGVCLEDKLFPKTNSFIGDGQPLADIEEFSGRLRAAKDAQSDDSFCLVARTEALISGRGMDEALRRAEAYRQAGADAILIHSKKSDAEEILIFARHWSGRSPLVIVPTTYCHTSTEVFRTAGISSIIWANHNLRSAVTAMREVCRTVNQQRSVSGIEGRITPIQDIFRLVNNKELDEAEKRYMPRAVSTCAVIVPALRRRGAEVSTSTGADVSGEGSNADLIRIFRDYGIHDIRLAQGGEKSKLDIQRLGGVSIGSVGELGAIAALPERPPDQCIVAYSHIAFRRHVLEGLLEEPGDIVLAVDALWRLRDRAGARDFIYATELAPSIAKDRGQVSVKAIGNAIAADKICGEWIGLVKLSKTGIDVLRAEMKELPAKGLARTSFATLLNRIARNYPIQVHYIAGHWYENAAPVCEMAAQ